MVDSAVAGITSVATTGGLTTLTTANGAADQARAAILEVTGVLASNATIAAPSGVSKVYLVANNTTGAHTLTMTVGGTTINITEGNIELCYTDGTNFYLVNNMSGLQGSYWQYQYEWLYIL